MNYILISSKPSDIGAMSAAKYNSNEFVVHPFVRHGRSFSILKCPDEKAAQYQADRYSSFPMYAKLFHTLNDAKEGLEGLIY